MTLSTSSETRPPEIRPPEARKDDPLLKLVFELGPLAVFFGVNAYVGKNGGIFTATAAFMIATLVALGVSYWRTRRLPIMPLVSGVVVLVFGTLTLVLHDELFIKLKPTIVNTLFGVVLLGGLVFGRSLLGIVFDAVFQLDERGWRILTFRWGLFFLALAVLNEVVWRNFSTDFWVTFKVFGIMPLTLVFAAAQVPLILRHSLEEEDGAAGTGAGDGI
ncbi:septation protein A [Methyloraptor flagellatus]|uniref:Inner membrane-spanning protein YciB n=1 Tax=Methyloraptor flagellatus TaxID=3162530 RepID=A0AAU7X834_9HYPH